MQHDADHEKCHRKIAELERALLDRRLKLARVTFELWQTRLELATTMVEHAKQELGEASDAAAPRC